MVPTYSAKIDEPLGKLIGLGEILWKELNQFEEETICSFAPESNNHISDFEDMEQVNMEEDIPDCIVEIELEAGEVWTWLTIVWGEATDEAWSKFTCCNRLRIRSYFSWEILELEDEEASLQLLDWASISSKLLKAFTEELCLWKFGFGCPCFWSQYSIVWLFFPQNEQCLGGLDPLKYPLPLPCGLRESTTLIMDEGSPMEEESEWLLLSSWITTKYTLLIEGSGSIISTWVLITLNWSFKLVKN